MILPMHCTSVKQNRNNKSPVIPNMITLRSENNKVIDTIVILVAVLVMNDMAGKKGMKFTHNVTRDTSPLPMDDKRVPVSMFQPSEIARLRAEYMLLLAYLATHLSESLPTTRAGYGDICGGLACIHPGLPQDFKYSLPRDPVLLGKCDHWNKPVYVGINYVNQLHIRQSSLCSHSFTSIFDDINIHSDGLVVKGKCEHIISSKTLPVDSGA
jgi:hypothetical protein